MMITLKKTPWAELLEVDKKISIEIHHDEIVCYSKYSTINKEYHFAYSSKEDKENKILSNYQDHFSLERAFGEKGEINLNPAILTNISFTGEEMKVNGRVLASGMQQILRDGDDIALSFRQKLKAYKFIDKRSLRSPAFSKAIDEKFFIGRVLGSGMNGKVWLAHNIQTLEKMAIKTLSKQKFNFQIDNEVSVMKKTDHPNVVRLFEMFDEAEQVFLLTKFMNCGDLKKSIKSSPQMRLPEKETKFAIFQITEGLQHLHDKNFAHLDLKCDNIFIESKNGMLIYKIGDFGFSATDENLTLKHGTVQYTPPEIFSSDRSLYSGKKKDIWSLGVIMYVCLVGKYPFDRNDPDFVKKVKVGRLYTNTVSWKTISPEAKDLVRQLIKVDPKKRLTTEEVLSHPWFDDHNLKIRVKSLKKMQRADQSKKPQTRLQTEEPAKKRLRLR